MKYLVLICVVFFSIISCKQERSIVVKMETSLGVIRFRLYDETVLHRENMIKLVREGYYNGMLFHRVIKDFMIQTGDPESRINSEGMLLGSCDAGYTLKAEIMPQYFHQRGSVAAARENENVNPDKNSSGSHFYIVQGKKFSQEGLDEALEKINQKRYTALFNRLKAEHEGEIVRNQLKGDYKKLMELNRELSNQTRAEFDKIKLVLSEEQRHVYTTQGGTPHLDGEYTVFGEVIEGMDVVDQIAILSTDDHCRPESDVVIKKMEIE